MAIADRSDKGGGRTNWQTGDPINQTPLEDDFANVYAQVNGGIDTTNLANNAVTEPKLASNAVTNVKVAAGANISVSKLDQSLGQLDMDIVDDFATNLAEYQTNATPGSSDSASLPTNLELEMSRLRYVVKRANIGASTIRSTGLACSWFDGLAVGPNLLTNGSFLDNSVVTVPGTAPFGWTLVGTPNAITPTTLPVQEGVGRYLRIVDAVGTGGAANQGIQQSLTGLKASTLYLVETRVLPTTSLVKLVTTGAAAGTFTNLSLNSGSGTGVWQTTAGLVWTNAVPDPLVIQLLSNATDYDFGIAYVSVREVSSDAASATFAHEGTTSRGGNLIRTITSTQNAAIDAGSTVTFQTGTTIHVVVPGPGYQIKVDAMAYVSGGGGGYQTTISLQQDINSAGTWPTVQDGTFHDSGAGTTSIPLHYVLENPTPGSLYSYRLSATEDVNASNFAGSATRLHRVSVDLRRTGE